MKLVLDPGRTPRLLFALGDSSVTEQSIKVRNIDSTKRLAAELVRSKVRTKLITLFLVLGAPIKNRRID